MTLLSVLAVAFVLYVLGRLLVRYLGWPTDLAGAGRWGFALLVAAVLLSGLPDLAAHVVREVGPLPRVSLVELVATTTLLGLGVLGYVAWTRGKEARSHGAEAQRLLPRRRAVPPAPPIAAEHGDPGFAPVADGQGVTGPHGDEE